MAIAKYRKYCGSTNVIVFSTYIASLQYMNVVTLLEIAELTGNNISKSVLVLIGCYPTYCSSHALSIVERLHN